MRNINTWEKNLELHLQFRVETCVIKVAHLYTTKCDWSKSQAVQGTIILHLKCIELQQ